MDKATRKKRDRLIIEAREARREIRLHPDPTAREIDAHVAFLDPDLHRRWSAAQDLKHRISTIRRVLREEDVPSPAIGIVPKVRRPLRPGHLSSPLWIVGKKQRDDLRPNYQPVPPEPEGSFAPQLLNRGRASATDIEVRIGSTYHLFIPLIGPGERADLLPKDDDRRFHALADLLGGYSDMSFARFETGPGRDYRHLVRIRFRYNRGSERWLRGEIRGTAKRYFYLFKPDRGRATPIY